MANYYDQAYVAVRVPFDQNDPDGVRLFDTQLGLHHFIRCNPGWVAANRRQPMVIADADRHGNMVL